MSEFRFDEIGYWSEVKLSIISEYAKAYSTIMSAEDRGPLRNRHVYIDGFAGAGLHISKGSREFVPGSPLNALLVNPPFSAFHLIDLHKGKVDHLRALTADRPEVRVYEADCNQVLIDQILPQVRYEDYRRALCVLDPYGLHLSWEVMRMAGTLGTVDIFLNFPVMDMNMNVLWHDPEKVNPSQAMRLTSFWGDESWRTAAYTTDRNLFAFEEKTDNDAVARAFRDRLKNVAGFKNVLEPMPMRNDQGATVYYLFFASQSSTGNHIAKQIFAKYGSRGRKDAG